MKPIITVENLSKQYRLGQVGTGTIKDDLKRWWYRALGKEDPFLRIGESNDRSTKGASEYVWALQDINFEVQPGEVLGIIGRNGAGKSTLLKILSRVTEPTTGRVSMNGRVASLLEVGTGMHPELTGRENIYLNGAILGMSKAEINRKLDEIIDFSGVERYIDTPVKRYSSGMHVRLGFAVAAHLEPEILIVDEVLAVGDAEFQKKCLGKMKDVSALEGRTVLFVSHNMGAIKALCNRVVYLNCGQVIFDGATKKGIEDYFSHNYINDFVAFEYVNNSYASSSDILQICLVGEDLKPTSSFSFDQSVTVTSIIQIDNGHENATFGIRVKDQLDRNVFSSEICLFDYIKQPGKFQFSVEIPPRTLVPNTYRISVALHKPNIEIIKQLDSAVQFSIEETGSDFFMYSGVDYGCVFVNCRWQLI